MNSFAKDAFSLVCTNLFGSGDAVNDWFTGDNFFDWGSWQPAAPIVPRGNIFTTIYNPGKLSKELVTGDFPPSDVIINSDKQLLIRLAVAGYKKGEIHIEQSPEDTDYLRVSVEPCTFGDEEKSKGNKKPDEVYLQQGISRRKARVDFYVDPKRFDISKVDASLSDGILRILVDVNKEQKVLKPIEIQ